MSSSAPQSGPLERIAVEKGHCFAFCPSAISWHGSLACRVSLFRLCTGHGGPRFPGGLSRLPGCSERHHHDPLATKGKPGIKASLTRTTAAFSPTAALLAMHHLRLEQRRYADGQRLVDLFEVTEHSVLRGENSGPRPSHLPAAIPFLQETADGTWLFMPRHGGHPKGGSSTSSASSTSTHLSP